MERNANHIIPRYCHLPDSCRNLVDRYGAIRSCESQINLICFLIKRNDHDTVILPTVVRVLNLNYINVFLIIVISRENNQKERIKA